MKVGVVLNGISLAKNSFYKQYLPRLQRDFDVEVNETRSANDAASIAASLLSNNLTAIITAGGDGTVNQVVNGLLSGDSGVPVPPLAVLPLGSGNDFARSLGLDNSPEALCDRLRERTVQTIDVGELHCASDPGGPANVRRLFVNVADLGMGPAVVRRVLNSNKTFGSAAAYYQSIIRTFFSYRPKEVIALGDGWEWEDRVRSFAVANAKYYGNGLCIAPDAVFDDGVFNIFACGPASVLDFVLQSIPLKAGRKVNHKHVRYFKSTEVQLSSDHPIEIEADGEIIGWLPAKVMMSSRKLQIFSSGKR